MSFHPRVAVPARNEALRLPILLKALANQTWQIASGSRLPVVIVLNNCDDISRQVLEAHMRLYPSLEITLIDVLFPSSRAHVGSARRLAMETAFAGADDISGTVLLTTDADAIPDSNWVIANLAAIGAGADIVGGEITGDQTEEHRLGPSFCRRVVLHKSYVSLADHLAVLTDPLPWDPAPRHCDHTGASIAVKATSYRSVGGLRALPFREDVDLIDRLRAMGARLRHDPSVRVTVSARLFGRAPGGMADCIRKWVLDEAEGRPHLVVDPWSVEQNLIRRREIRNADCKHKADVADLARYLKVAQRELVESDGSLRSVDMLIDRFAPDDLDLSATVPVHTAMAFIRHRIALLEGQVDAA